jgi:hypothetical protein
MLLLGSVGSPEPHTRLVPILTRVFGKLVRPFVYPWMDLQAPEAFEPPAKVTALTKLAFNVH